MVTGIAAIALIIFGIILFTCPSAVEESKTENNNLGSEEKTINNNSGSEEKTKIINNNLGSEDEIRLVFWNIAHGGTPNRHAYDMALSEMKRKYPNIIIDEMLYENETYKEKIKNAAAARELPDIFFTWSGGFLGDFVNDGLVYELGKEMSSYIKNKDITKAMLENTNYNGKYYDIPMNFNIVTLFANMDILKEVGYDHIPKTFDELKECCDKLVRKNIIPFGCAGQETWCVTEYLEPIMEKLIGADVLKDIFQGKASWDNQGISSAVDILQGMIKAGYFDPDAKDMIHYEAMSNFMGGRYAFYMNGSWNCADLANSNLVDFKVGVGEFPVLDTEAGTMGQFIGGPSDTLAVSSRSKNAKIAAEYAIELGKLICKYAFLDGGGLPAWKVDYDVSSVNDLTKSIAEQCVKTDKYVLFGDVAMSGQESAIYLGYVDQIFSLEIDGKEFTKLLKKEIR